MARRIAGGLAAAGACVVSGMARGIDGESHAGALAAGGATAAVLGSGPDVLYPRRNASLGREVASYGCLLSEYPPGTPPERFRFPERNRLISGLSLGLVVVEAGSRSGTMITVGTALDQGREVMAVPGDATRTTSAGSNRLLREGAAPVTSAEEVLEVLGLAVEPRAPAPADGAATALGRSILKMLDDGPAHLDEMARSTGAPIPRLREELLKLELAGALIRRPGGIYARV
jgi:DNA processing protein